MALNTSGYSGISEANPLDISMLTVPNLNKELMSLDEYYRDKGYAIHLGHPDVDDGMSMVVSAR